jgi:drug/metabolite transporter (DMT)-like permease
MGYFLAILSAATYGAADFLGGLASKRASTIAVVFWSQASGLLLLLLTLPLLPDASPSRTDWFWGAVAGLAGSVGVGLLYRALAIGTMAVVAPTTAVCAVVIPVMAGVLAGERLAGWTIAGIVLALVAIVLVSRETPDNKETSGGRATAPHRAGVRGGDPATAPHRAGVRGGDPAPGEPDQVRPPRHMPRGMGIAFLSGVAIGFFFLALARTSSAAGMWPLVASRSLSLVLFGAIGAAMGQLRMAAPAAKIALGSGVVDMIANALYLTATRFGPLSVMVTLTSLYPASTVVLARIVLGERLSRLQVAGVFCALGAIVLIVGIS